MKLASIEVDGGATVAVRAADGTLVDLRDLDAGLPTDMRSLLELGPDVLRSIGERVESVDRRWREDEVRFAPVVRDAQAIWCLALNYRMHIEEGSWETPEHPAVFLRVAESLCGHGQPIVQPAVSDRLDYEGELAVVIGRRARHVPEAEVDDVIAGYACFNDGSVRDWQRHTRQITPGKNFAATGGFGPWLTTRDEVGDIERALLQTTLNGRVMQSARIDELIFGIPQLISYVSTICDLVPGDVIVTGTPGGVGTRQDPPVFLRSGDVVEVSVEGVGHLRNPVVREDELAVGDTPRLEATR